MTIKRIFLLFLSTMLCFSVEAQRRKPLFKNVADGWAFVPEGSFNLMKSDKGGSPTDTSLMQKVQSFWMSKTEVTNLEYKEFVAFIKKSGDGSVLKKIFPDTLVWRFEFAYNEPYVKYYFNHPAYYDYPVVGVSHEAALLYCQWLTDIYNAKLKELFPKLQAKKVEVRLPSLNEWMWAAKGGNHSSPYPWGTPYLRNTSKMFYGDFMCNFSRIGDGAIHFNASTGKAEIVPGYLEDYMGVAGRLNDHADITAPVKSYWKNGYGLYNMAGNVAEMIDRPGTAKGGSWRTCGYDVQIEAPDPFEGDKSPKAWVGFRPILVIVE